MNAEVFSALPATTLVADKLISNSNDLLTDLPTSTLAHPQVSLPRQLEHLFKIELIIQYSSAYQWLLWKKKSKPLSVVFKTLHDLAPICLTTLIWKHFLPGSLRFRHAGLSYSVNMPNLFPYKGPSNCRFPFQNHFLQSCFFIIQFWLQMSAPLKNGFLNTLIQTNCCLHPTLPLSQHLSPSEVICIYLIIYCCFSLCKF